MKLEPLILAMVVKLQSINESLKKSEVIGMMNDMIEFKKVGVKLREFKIKYCGESREDATASIGSGWYHRFKERNKHVLKADKIKRVSKDRAEWCTWVNVRCMYQRLHQMLVDSGNAIILEHPVWYDKEGNIVDKSNSFGFAAWIRIHKPENCFFF